MGMDRGRRVVTADEAKLWRDAMRGVTPFPDRLPVEPATKPSLAAPAPSFPVLASPVPAPSGQPPAPRGQPPAMPIIAHGRSPGLDRRTAERLRKGDMPIDASLDLHGMTQEIAHAALWRFVSASAERGHRCILVITGKGGHAGGGVLRAQAPRWLNEPALRPLVLGFTFAQPKHGGDGALYVLLKRRR